MTHLFPGNRHLAGQGQIEGNDPPAEHDEEEYQENAGEHGQRDSPRGAPSAVAEELVVRQTEYREVHKDEASDVARGARANQHHTTQICLHEETFGHGDLRIRARTAEVPERGQNEERMNHQCPPSGVLLAPFEDGIHITVQAGLVFSGILIFFGADFCPRVLFIGIAGRHEVFERQRQHRHQQQQLDGREITLTVPLESAVKVANEPLMLALPTEYDPE